MQLGSPHKYCRLLLSLSLSGAAIFPRISRRMRYISSFVQIGLFLVRRGPRTKIKIDLSGGETNNYFTDDPVAHKNQLSHPGFPSYLVVPPCSKRYIIVCCEEKVRCPYCSPKLIFFGAPDTTGGKSLWLPPKKIPSNVVPERFTRHRLVYIGLGRLYRVYF